MTHYFPQCVKRRRSHLRTCPHLPEREPSCPRAEALVDMLRLCLKACAAEHQVVPRIIADKDDLEALALGKRENIHALSGWRYEIFGKARVAIAGRKNRAQSGWQKRNHFYRCRVIAHALSQKFLCFKTLLHVAFS